MTEKQFIYNRCEDGFYDIIDIKNHHAYPIGNMEIFIIGIVELLNNLAEKNKNLKKKNEQLKQLLLQFYTEDEINAEMI